jgi:glycosyltransferase involved in cell wall biosynthesis
MYEKYVTLSTVTPVYGGEKYLEELVNELKSLREEWKSSNAPIQLVESIFVDDGSKDRSSEILREIAGKESWVRVVTLSRNFGQHSATVAGICHTMSDWIVSLDEDLQHRPAMIMPLLQEAITKKLDVVYAKPLNSVHGNSWRDKASKLVKRLLAKLSQLEQIKMFNSFRLVRGSIARAAASSSSSQTYLDIALSWYTQSAGNIVIPMHDDRFVEEKKSGYGLLGLIKHARRLMVSSEMNIAKIGLGLGVCAVLLALFLGGNVLFVKLFYPAAIDQVGWASLAAIICAFSGIIVTLICIVMEYTNVILLNQLGRPTFFTVDRSDDKLLEHWLSKSKE